MSYTHFSDTTPKARKKYRCYLCERTIEVGVKHVARRGADDGQAFAFRMHIECEKLTAKWDEDDWLYHEPSEFRAELQMGDKAVS